MRYALPLTVTDASPVNAFTLPRERHVAGGGLGGEGGGGDGGLPGGGGLRGDGWLKYSGSS
jgi:hypothetical protein